ncbi:hypothetical protein LINPERHAP1_LOCUS19155 [Linum perenne]
MHAPAPAEKPDKFGGTDFKRWQQKIFIPAVNNGTTTQTLSHHHHHLPKPKSSSATKLQVCFSSVAYAKKLIHHLKSLHIQILPGLSDSEYSDLESTTSKSQTVVTTASGLDLREIDPRTNQN